MGKKITTPEKIIGIIGVGKMGGYLANRFLTKNYTVFLYDLNNNKLKKFLKKGAVAATSPKFVAQKADIIFEITPNDESSSKVWMGENGILNGATSEKFLIASSTLSIEWIDKLSQICQEKGFHFFDIGINGAINGINFLCGGDRERLQVIKPVLRSVAQKVIYFGPSGQGMRSKLIVNFLQAVHIIGFRQAMKIARENHMNLKKVAKCLIERPGGIFTQYAWDAYQQDTRPSFFKIELITKDLKYTQEFARNLDISLLEGVLSEYQQASESGYSKKDWLNIVNLK